MLIFFVLGAPDTGKSKLIDSLAPNREIRDVRFGPGNGKAKVAKYRINNGQQIEIAFVEIPTELYDNPDFSCEGLQKCIKAGDGACILFSHTDSSSRSLVEQWVKFIKRMKENFPLAVVGTKHQQAPPGYENPHFGGNKYGKVKRSDIDFVEGKDTLPSMKPFRHILQRINSPYFQGNGNIFVTPATIAISLVPEQHLNDLNTIELALGTPTLLGREHLFQNAPENKEAESLRVKVSRESCQVTLQDDGIIYVKRLGKQPIALWNGSTRKVLEVMGDVGVLPAKNGKIQFIDGVEDLTWSVETPRSHLEHENNMHRAQLEDAMAVEEDEEDPGIDDAFSRFSINEEKKDETDDEETDEEEDINDRATQEELYSY